MQKLFYDFEVYKNFWLVSFKNTKGNRTIIHSRMNYKEPLSRLLKKVNDFIFVGVNNSRYDTLMLNYLLQYFPYKSTEDQTKEMYEMSRKIIEEDIHYKSLMADKKVKERTYEMDVLNYLGQGMGAKEMACRLHHPKLESLPIHPQKNITDEDIATLIEYCNNDVDIVERIVNEVTGTEMQVALDIIEYFNLDKKLMSTTLGTLVETALVDPNIKPNPPEKWRYKAPVDFNFQTQEFKDVEDTFKGLMLEPKYKFKHEFYVGDMKVSMGMGGAHGAINKTYMEDLIDIDIDQYYPQTKYNFNFLSNSLRDKSEYGKLIDNKKKYAKEGDRRVKAVKLIINTIFGRQGYPNGKLYAPDMLYQTTITGQLLQLRLVEDLTIAGFEVIYLNTDGLTINNNGDDSYIDVVNKWAEEFGYEYKTEHFKRAYYRDVNNFIAEAEDGSLKRKGDMDTSASKKNSCFARVSVDAVVEYLIHGRPIRDYINSKSDLRDFLMYHKFNRDMRVWLIRESKPRKRLPNVVRYYISKTTTDKIMYDKGEDTSLSNRNYNKNVRLVKEFDPHDYVPIPKNLDKETYVRIAFDILQKMTGKDVEDNPYIEEKLKQLGVNIND